MEPNFGLNIQNVDNDQSAKELHGTKRETVNS